MQQQFVEFRLGCTTGIHVPTCLPNASRSSPTHPAASILAQTRANLSNSLVLVLVALLVAHGWIGSVVLLWWRYRAEKFAATTLTLALTMYACRRYQSPGSWLIGFCCRIFHFQTSIRQASQVYHGVDGVPSLAVISTAHSGSGDTRLPRVFGLVVRPAQQLHLLLHPPWRSGRRS